MIQVDRIWLFETQVLDPYYFGKIDGVEVFQRDERTISLLTIDTVDYEFSSVAKGGFSFRSIYGGEDKGALTTLGKQEYEYTLEFDLPLYSGRIIDELSGRLYSILCERRNGTRFVVFAQFEPENLDVENEQQTRVTLKSGRTSAQVYNVNSLNIGEVLDTIDMADICANLDKFNRMNYDFFPTTNIPSNFEIIMSGNISMTFRWGIALGAQAYELRWGNTIDNLTNIVTIQGGGTTEVTIDDMPYNTAVFAKIKAVGQFVDSFFTPIISGSTAGLAAPQNYAVSEFTETTFDSSWDAVDGADSYTVEWGLDGISFPNTQVVGDVTEATITGVTSGMTIYSRVFGTLGVNEGDRSDIASGDTIAGSFIHTIDTSLGDGLDQYILPVGAATVYPFDVDWGDSNEDTITSAADPNLTHSYSSGGIYNVAIDGVINVVFANSGDVFKLTGISNWGQNIVSANSFYGARNLEVTANDTPTIASMLQAFRNTISMIGSPSFNDWDLSGIVGGSLNNCFLDSAFNQPIGNWDVSGVTTATSVFKDTPNFNQDLSSWDVSGITTMASMFQDAISFNQSLASWDISSVTSMANMLDNTALSTANYDATLIGWAAQSIQPNVPLGANGRTYTLGGAAEAARDVLLAAGWIITGDSGI